MTGGIAMLTFAIVKANDWGWTSPGITASFALAIVLACRLRASFVSNVDRQARYIDLGHPRAASPKCYRVSGGSPD
jgi:hypothetical protein